MNVVDEALFQKAVTTLDMVKGDALSEHCVPMNLVALPLLLPARFFLSSVSCAPFDTVCYNMVDPLL